MNVAVSTEQCCNETGSGALQYSEHSVTVLILKLTWTGPGVNPGLRGEIPATSRVIGKSSQSTE